MRVRVIGRGQTMRLGWTKTSAGLSGSGAARTTVWQLRHSTSVQCGATVLWRQSSGCATVSEAARVRASRTHATGDAGQRHAHRSVSGGGACCVTDSCTATDTFRQGQYSRICVLPPPLPVNRAMRTTTAKKSHSLKEEKGRKRNKRMFLGISVSFIHSPSI